MSNNQAIEIDLLTGPIPVPTLVDQLPVDKKIDLYGGLGHVTLVDMMPRMIPAGRTADIAIARNARVSYALGDKTIADDTRLINYLMENRHTSPFESVEFQFRIRLPIFVQRQLIRHRTAGVNEESFRYIQPRDDIYFPPLRMQSANNKQGSDDKKEVPVDAIQVWNSVKVRAQEMYQLYTELVRLGVAREVARVCLPVNMMTELMWKIDLHNLLHFLQLRLHPHAQKEIQDLAAAMLELIRPLVPVSVEAFDIYRLKSISFSGLEVRALHDRTVEQLGEKRMKSIEDKISMIFHKQ